MQGRFTKQSRWNFSNTPEIHFFENGRFEETYQKWGSWTLSNALQLTMKYDDGLVLVSQSNERGDFVSQDFIFKLNEQLCFQVYFNPTIIINGEPDCFIKFFTHNGHCWFISGAKTFNFSPEHWRNLLNTGPMEENDNSDSDVVVEQINGTIRFVNGTDVWTMPINACRNAIETVAVMLEENM
jgi:hypothetical protein